MKSEDEDKNLKELRGGKRKSFSGSEWDVDVRGNILSRLSQLSGILQISCILAEMYF